MERYLKDYSGVWKLITDKDLKEDFFHCDLCRTHGSWDDLRRRVFGVDGRKFSHFEPYLCLDHGRELGVVW